MNQANVFTPSQKPLGFWGKVGFPARGPKLHQALHDGFPFDVYSKLAKLSGLDKSDLASATVIASATLQRRAKSGKFNRDESDRLYRFAEVFKAALDLFEGNNDSASLWLKSQVRGLGNKRPVDMLATSAETEAVLDLIGRLEHGVFA
ncbi:antitoxin [Pseudoalteromonas sp. NBT06-2]|uniref:type II RES/Xre toxin-antitoxin system antitoxin n=1 Tax=Pseudoalteromonas sp. NBT06-2 TaxID=2025950 RepID=UPI000BA69F2F|nr:antitoxin Xre-like helix-turn-helix domain-containing protein [Pseudoalteromonas sp. NBT06-2]PAJ76260.1 antitoxin [Pseudoalteromonas sp. NBT06-2]